MAERPLRIVLDDHVFAKLELDLPLFELLSALIFDGSVAVLMPYVYRNKLQARSGGMPKWLPIRLIPDTTLADADVLVSDDPARRRRGQVSGHFEALTYEEFAELLKLLQLKTQAP